MFFPAASSQTREQALTCHIQRERIVGGQKRTDSLHLQRAPSTWWALPQHFIKVLFMEMYAKTK